MKKKIVFAMLFISAAIKSTEAQYWSALGNGIGHPRWNMVYNSEGTESGTDAPVTGDPVASICFYNGELYAGGFFDYTNGPASNIVKYNGTNWSSLGGGVHTVGGGGYDSWVNKLMVYNGELYVAGRFTHAGNTEANNIVKWNGSQWAAVGKGLGEYGNEVSSLVIYNGELYAGGHFNKSGDVQINNIAKWNGDQWLPVGSGIDVYMDYFPYGTVSSLVVHNGALYAGGNFDTTGVGTNNIVKWDGTSWSAVGTGINNSVFCLTSYNGALFAGGNFINLRRWDGNEWSELSPGINGYVYALLVNHSILYAGGSFDTAGQAPANNIAQWNGTEWSTLGKGMNNGVSCMTAYDHAFFCGR